MKSLKEFINENEKELPVYFKNTTYKKGSVPKKPKKLSSKFYNTQYYQVEQFHKKISQILENNYEDNNR